MSRLGVALRMSLGGAVCGGFLGIFAGGLFGAVVGLFLGNVSIGLDAALLVGCLGGLTGVLVGVFLAVGDTGPLRTETAPHPAERPGQSSASPEPHTLLRRG
jgi:hypothetical protein